MSDVLMQQANPLERSRNFFFLIRLILFVLIGGLCVFELFMNFRGLSTPAAMDQAQIARQIARGEGFTSKCMRPLDIVTKAPKKSKKVDFNHFTDTNYAPLHAYAVSSALSMGGYDNFENTRMDSEVTNVYNGDRWVAGVSMLFFVISLVLAYFLFSNLFDEVLGSTVVAFMGLSELMLDYAVSGLAQPMLMSLLLSSVCCLGIGIKAYHAEKTVKSVIFVVLALLFTMVMSMSCYLSAWCAVGLIIFCSLYFRPIGMYAVVGILLMMLTVFLPVYLILEPMGGLLPRLLHSIFFSFGSETGELLLRSTADNTVGFNSTDFFLRLLGYVFAQWGTLFHDMGGIIVTPFFFLALFNRYKKAVVEGIKWAVFSMWMCAGIGMALFSEQGNVSPTQLSIIFAPFFTAYGIALVFNFLSRLQLGANFYAYRALAITTLLLISSGAFMFDLPQKIHFGILTSARGIPHFPPYYPAALNGRLHDITNADDLIITDQPWAVAWYADRKAVWMPVSLDAYTRDLDTIFNRSKQGVQGFLITPTSHTMPAEGISGIVRQSGDFAPLALEGKILMLLPKHNVALADAFTEESQNTDKSLASLVSSQGRFSHRNFLLGAEIVYYSREEIREPEPTK